MSIIIALHYCCIMKTFLMSHKVNSFPSRKTLGVCLPCKRDGDEIRWITGLYGSPISFRGYSAVILHFSTEEKVF